MRMRDGDCAVGDAEEMNCNGMHNRQTCAYMRIRIPVKPYVLEETWADMWRRGVVCWW